MHTLILVVACLSLLLLTSCRRLPKAGPTPRPSITPTPRSTALPPVPTLAPAGTQENPLHMAVVAPDAAAIGQVVINAIESAMLTQANLYVVVDLVSTDADALAALCNSPGGTVSAAWLGGLAYVGAYAQECGSAALQVERGSTDDEATGDTARVIVNPALDVSSIGDLAGHSFCRIGYDDMYSWMIPSLMLRAAGVNSADLLQIIDYQDMDTLVADVANGACDAAGIAGSQLEADSGVRTLQESVAIPYRVLVVPEQVPFGQRQQLVDTLVAMSEGAQPESLEVLLDQTGLIPAEDNDFTSLRGFINRSGIDLAQAGT
jgi:ABC-type phosphate/phosphonate transport system substrate-binding protein